MRIFTFASLIFLIFASSVIIVQKNGLLHPEAIERIPNYLDGRNLFQKVFDIDKNEYGLYQARELSHFFDYMDANFIKFSVSISLPHFYSLTYFISIFIIIASSLHLSITYLKHRNFLLPSLIVMIYLFSPVPFFSPYMFRSAKILVAVGIALIWVLILRFLSQKSNASKTYLLIVAGAMLLASGDRQGFYILVAMAGFTLLSFLFFRWKKYLYLFKYLTIGAIISIIYSYIIAPELIKIDIGHFPSLEYQKIDFTLIKPIFFRYSTLYSLDIFKYFFGNLNRILILFFLLIFLAIYTTLQANKVGQRLKYVFLLVIGIFAVFFLNTFMILKHNAIPLEDVRRVYYSLPVLTIILLCSLYFCAKVTGMYPKTYKYLLLLLFLILTLNIFSLGDHYKIIKNGLLKQRYDDSPKIISCINSHQTYGFQLRDDARNFCELMKTR